MNPSPDDGEAGEAPVLGSLSPCSALSSWRINPRSRKSPSANVRTALRSVVVIVLSTISDVSISVPSVATIVTASAPSPVVVIPLPAVSVTLSPDVIVEFDPDVATSVKRVVEEVKHVGHAMFPATDNVIGAEADTATVPFASGRIIVL